MGWCPNFTSIHGLRYITIYLLFLLILSSTQLKFMAEGRAVLFKPVGFSQPVSEEKAIVRAQIGSRPPKCERRCNSCGHCEAIQVPANPQVKTPNTNSSTVFGTIAYSRGDDNSNYKPMSWKCKCGNFVFNP
ncbi:EPIDERMAL PATTERNING FACTOR-like protein 2 [Vitis riparia]|uniref:EPIDERMAL PATTERNING FACTOR-like protein 2 n=1 Tax=Vitis riparia TaxID=96939 RepID=UPI00155A5EE6|nr:EPIDERMAL PATTERNING FACTOR-like protein 2 [Vitis riparia]